MSKILLVLSLVFFAASLTQPAVEFEKVCRSSKTHKLEVAGLWQQPLGTLEKVSGLKLLLWGGFGVLFAQAGAFGWLANPLYMLAFWLMFTNERKRSKKIALASLVTAVLSLPFTNLFPVHADEGGVCYLSALRPDDGCWLWLGAIFILNAYFWCRRTPLQMAP